MSETVKLIIEIPKDMFEWFKNEEIIDEYDESALKQVFKNGIPLDDVKEKIAKLRLVGYADALGKYEIASKAVMDVLDNIGKENTNAI